MGGYFTLLNSKTIDITLSSSKWSGSSAPYSYVISNEHIGVDNICDLIFNPNSQQLVDTLSDSEISGYLQETGKITIYSWGTKPNIDIPIILIVRGGI